jgi:asparagine synthase (glutamine-hydrolysing)
MSGIFGALHLDGRPADPNHLEAAVLALAFRGPDGRGVWWDGSVGLGHTALETADPRRRPAQPLTLDGEVWITADVRLDGRGDLIRALEARGVRAAVQAGDAELLLDAYAAWGEDCVAHLLGDFAFGLWDGRRRRLFCGRDHLGVKPFYYAFTGSSFFFSNTLAVLRQQPGVSARVNDAAVGDFLLAGLNWDPGTTLFHDIQRLPPAHCLSFPPGPPRPRRYWQVPTNGQLRYRRPQEYVDHFAALLQAAVADRIPADGRTSVLMSGGLDSTSVAAFARRREGGRPTGLLALTLAADKIMADEEGRYAEIAARALDIPIAIRPIADDTPYERWDALGAQLPQPLDYPLAAVFDDLYRRAADHGRVVLTGDGGDVVLYPNPHYFVGLLARGRLRDCVREIGRFVGRYRRWPPLGLRLALADWLGRAAPRLPPYPAWLERSFAERWQLRSRWETINRGPPVDHPTHPQACRALLSPAVALFFDIADPEWTRLALEFRQPLFDVRLIEYVLAIPPLPWCFSKDILRRSTAGLLPDTIRLRRKTLMVSDPANVLIRRRAVLWQELLEPTEALERYVDVAAWRRLTAGEDPAVAYDRHRVGRALHLNCWLRGLNHSAHGEQPESAFTQRAGV